MKTNGKMNNNPVDMTLQSLFQKQVDFQNTLIDQGKYNQFMKATTETAPSDDIGICSYHIQQLISEIGEVLSSDKRWKSHRSDKYDMANKLEELADCFIVLMNIVMFSGFDGDDLVYAILTKMKINKERIVKE